MTVVVVYFVFLFDYLVVGRGTHSEYGVSTITSGCGQSSFLEAKLTQQVGPYIVVSH